MSIIYRLYRLYAVSPMYLLLLALCTGLAAGLNLSVPLILKAVLDDGLGKQQLHFVYLASGLLLAVTLLRGVMVYGYNYLAAALAQRFAYRLRNQFYDQMQRLSFSYHDQAQTGELMSRATADVEAVRMFFHFGLPTVLSVSVTGVGTVVALAWLDWRLAAIVLGSVPFFLVVAVAVGRWLQPLQKQVQMCLGRLTVILQESLAGIRVVKAFAREQDQTTRFVREAEALYGATVQVAHTQALLLPLFTLLLALGLALTLYVGGRQVIAGTISLGTLVAATGYLAQLVQPLRRLGWITGMASYCQAGGTRLFEVLDAVSAVQERPQARALPRLQGRLCFQDVGFAYDNQMPVLHNISFTAAPDEVVALLGSTGSGKSTVAQLIPRFYDVTRGGITLDGVDIRDLQLQALRQHIGIVMQDTGLFSTTLRDNIAYGRPDISDAAIIAAAQAARAHDFIMQCPDGYDTWVGERGVTLSGGQRQRIAIARAFVRDPRLLILDDATSSVDMETEYLIQQALAELMVGRTTVVIAQRLRTLKGADTILVLEHGRITQRGAHDTLVTQPGLYQRIYDLQLRDQEAVALHATRANGHAVPQAEHTWT